MSAPLRVRSRGAHFRSAGKKGSVRGAKKIQLSAAPLITAPVPSISMGVVVFVS